MKKILKNSYLHICLIDLLIICICGSLLKIYPFGNQSIFFLDGDQYISFNQMFVDSILNHKSLLYSFHNVLGGNTIGLIGYYCLSPLNILLLPFKDNIILGTTLLMVLKMILSSFNFLYMSKALHYQNNWLNCLLAMIYPFIGFTFAFIWNPTWIDGVMILPLIYLGFKKLYHNNQPLLYVCSLVYILISNFYIAYMICIAIILFFLKEVIEDEESFSNAFKDKCWRFIKWSLLSAGFVAFLLLPIYKAMPKGRKLPKKELLQMFLQRKEIDQSIPSMLLTGSMTQERFMNNGPVIFTSILVELYALLFFVSKQTSKKEKVGFGFLILVMIVSFYNQGLDIVWHGFSENSAFNYRYSFIVSFMFLLMVLEVFKHKIETKEVMVTGIIALSFIAMFISKYSTYLLVFDAIIVVVWMILSIVPVNKMLQLVTLTLLVVSDLCVNAYVTTVSAQPTYDVNEFIAYQNTLKQDIATIKDDDFYRMDKTIYSSVPISHVDPHTNRCDAMLLDYNGVTNYASTENKGVLEFVSKCGVNSVWMMAHYSEHVPSATDALFGMRYLISKQPLLNKQTYNVEQLPSNHYLSKNPYAFPLLMKASYLFNETDEFDDIELLNPIYSSIYGEACRIFERQEIEVDESNQVIRMDIKHTGSYYISNMPDLSKINVEVGNHLYEIDSISKWDKDLYLGDFKKGENVVMTFEFSNEQSLHSIYAKVLYENLDEIKKVYQTIEDTNETINERNSNDIQTFIHTTKQDQLIVTTIPFDEGWKINVDGKLVDVMCNWNHFIAFNIEDIGEHQVMMHYVPSGMKQGMIVSIISLFVLLLCLFKEHKK